LGLISIVEIPYLDAFLFRTFGLAQKYQKPKAVNVSLRSESTENTKTFKADFDNLPVDPKFMEQYI